MTKKDRKAKLLADIRTHHVTMSQKDPDGIASEQELAECRRLIREQYEVGVSEGEYLQAIHGKEVK